MTQRQLPFELIESRAAKRERLLSGKLAGKVTTAARMFTKAEAERAEAIAKEDQDRVR